MNAKRPTEEICDFIANRSVFKPRFDLSLQLGKGADSWFSVLPPKSPPPCRQHVWEGLLHCNERWLVHGRLTLNLFFSVLQIAPPSHGICSVS